MTTFTSNGSARVFEDAKGIQIEFDSSDMFQAPRGFEMRPFRHWGQWHA